MTLSHALRLGALGLSLGAALQVSAADATDAAGASPAVERLEVGTIADRLSERFAQSCEAARHASETATPDKKDMASMQQELNCECGPRALAAAFPADTRAILVSRDEFFARFSGASNVCADSAMLRQVQLACARGADPFAHPGDAASPERAKARCACATARLEPLAHKNPAEAAQASAAAYAMRLAAHPDDATPAEEDQGPLLNDIAQSCAAAGAPAR